MSVNHDSGQPPITGRLDLLTSACMNFVLISVIALKKLTAILDVVRGRFWSNFAVRKDAKICSFVLSQTIVWVLFICLVHLPIGYCIRCILVLLLKLFCMKKRKLFPFNCDTLDEMGSRIDELEKSINDLKAEMEADSPIKPNPEEDKPSNESS